MIIQWGTFTTSINNQEKTVTFNISFTTTNYSISVLGDATGQTSTEAPLCHRTKNKGSVIIVTNSRYGNGFDWMAIGY